VVGDGSPIYALPKMINTCETWPYILLYPWNADGYGTPRILAEHGSTFNGNPAHCHPRFTPDGKHVLYTSDTSGYANVYMVEVGKLDELPVLRI
jgi:oligogalacturonide lyase